MIKVAKTHIFPYNHKMLWNTITDNQDYTWRSDLSSIKIIDESHFIEFTKNNYPTYFTITKKEPYSLYAFTMENTNIKGNWYGTLKQIDENQTMITLVEEIEVSNAIMRLFAKLYLNKQQKKYIQDLEKKMKNEIPKEKKGS